MNRNYWKAAFFVLAATVAVFAVGFAAGTHWSEAASEPAGRVSHEIGSRPIPHNNPPGGTPESDSLAEVAEAVLPVVVEVSVVETVEQEGPRSPFDFFFGPRQDRDQREFERPGLGSGVIIESDGRSAYVLTNNHVVGDAEDIEISLYDGRQYEAEKLGGDPRMDIAVLEFTPGSEVPVARLGDSDRLRVGDWVMAVGNPFGFESTVTAGIVSALGRRGGPGGQIPELTDFIQTDAAINPGNSGGALVNLQGEIVGINTWIAGTRTGGNVGLGFAIPINSAAGAVTQLLEHGEIEYGWLGVSITDADRDAHGTLAEDLGVKDDDGSLVLQVYQDSPAAEGGLRPGDFITHVEHEPIGDTVELQRGIGALSPGQDAEFRVIRNGRPLELTVTLGRRAPEEEIARTDDLWPGLVAWPLTEEVRERAGIEPGTAGAVIVEVMRNSVAAAAGLRPGDVITEVNGTSIDDAGQFYAEISEATGQVQLELVRDGRRLSVVFPAL